MSTQSLDQPGSSSASTTTRTAMRQHKLSVSAPTAVPRLTGTEPLLETMSGSAGLLEQLKPTFTSSHHLQAIVLSGRQLPLLTKDEAIMPYMFNAAGVRYVQPHPSGDASQRILLLNIPADSPTPEIILSTIEKHSLHLLPSFTLSLGYDHLSSDQILEALLPQSLVAADGVPSGFTIVGHIAHLNLLPVYTPYRFLVGHIILSKHAPHLRTVVNKLDSIDTEFRFFKMELLAGVPEYTARVSESECTFEFDFRSVYWNSRLHAEHARLIRRCRVGQVLGDVMAGVGPFAVPAGKRGTWVIANDLNPSSFESLERNARLNKVLLDDEGGKGPEGQGGVVAKCMDGRAFVRWSMEETWKRAFAGRMKGYDGTDGEMEDERLREDMRKQLKVKAKAMREVHAAKQAAKTNSFTTETNDTADKLSNLTLAARAPEPARHEPRRLIDHFILNLPATALEFLDAFRGAYTHLATIVTPTALESELSLRASSADRTLTPTPMIHVHCFSKDPFTPALDILNRANFALGIPPDASFRLKARPLPPPTQTLAGLRKSASTQDAEVGNYLTSHPNYNTYKHLSTSDEFMSHVEHEWHRRDGGQATAGLEIHYVRDVAPNKQMYCLSFPCPVEVLWAKE
ncbi:tRNA transferase Trm5/Tyw2 [Kalmanozyma brasiliensis GHG001]|uniref:tRNA (guanine(37)-N1)-methyltransferase n=1 Tax=Kalmanozyma brasiliensis (strain GHG001) TaxID=1365824 RepID=V5EWG7_KALBG|nr:tRNA transferase Trm5/Tyw2 [Kalmanozyma brasiliensis GHG001]EST09920.1 tRNA transferase Trm5/Tyw2 [Kalmanozyma brasiliensis GHG001]